MTLYFEQQTEQGRARRPVAQSLDAGNTGAAGIDAKMIIPFVEGWAIQPPQPPALRRSLRHSAIFPWDGDFNDNSSKIFVPGPQGADIVQAWAPPYPLARAMQRSAAVMRGEDGIQAAFVPPWVMAAPRTTFPSVQSSVAAATPSYDAGPQVGSISSQPGIVNPAVLKAAPGTLFQVNVIVAGTAPGAAYDVASNSPVQNFQIAVIPNTVGPVVLEWPCQQGILLVPGTGQMLAAKWC